MNHMERLRREARLARRRILLEDRLARRRIEREHTLALERIELQAIRSRECLELANGGSGDGAMSKKGKAAEATELRKRLRAMRFVVHEPCTDHPEPHLLGELHLHPSAPDEEAECKQCGGNLSEFHEVIFAGPWTATEQPVRWNALCMICENCGMVDEMNPSRAEEGIFYDMCLDHVLLFETLEAFAKGTDETSRARRAAAAAVLARQEQLLFRRLMHIRGQRAAFLEQGPEPPPPPQPPKLFIVPPDGPSAA